MSEENQTRELLRGTSRAQKYFLLTKCWLRPDSRVAVKYFTRKKLTFSCACMDSLFVLMDGWSGISFSKKHFRISVLYMSGWSGRPVEDDVFYIYLDEVAYSFPWNFMIRLFYFSLYFWSWYTNISFEYFRPNRVLVKNFSMKWCRISVLQCVCLDEVAALACRRWCNSRGRRCTEW